MQSKKQNNKQETLMLSKNGFVKLYILASCLGIVSLMFMLFGTNGAERTQDKIMIGSMIVVVCFFLFSAYLYSRWYIKFEIGSLEYRSVFGKVKIYSLQEIVELKRERNEGIVAKLIDGKVLKFVQIEEKVYMEHFCKMNSLTIEPYDTKKSFEVSFHPLIRFCCGFTFFVGIGFWLLSLPFEIYGFVTGLIFLLFFGLFVYVEMFYKLFVKHQTLCEKDST